MKPEWRYATAIASLARSSSHTTGVSFNPAGAGFDLTRAIDIDGSGNVWVVNNDGGTVSQLIGLAVPATNESIPGAP